MAAEAVQHETKLILRIKLTLRYICPCPPAVPLKSTDWLMVEVAEAPTGRLLVVDPDPDVTLACEIRMSQCERELGCDGAQTFWCEREESVRTAVVLVV